MSTNKSITDLLQIFEIADPTIWWYQVQKELSHQSKYADLDWLMDVGISIPPNPSAKSGYTPITWQQTHNWKIAEKHHGIITPHQMDDLQNFEIDELILEVTGADQLLQLQSTWPESKFRISLEMPAKLAVQASKLRPNNLDFVRFLPLSDQTIESLTGRNTSYSWYYSEADQRSSPIESLELVLLQILKHLSYGDGYPAGGRIYLPIQDSFLTEIAKIRALKILLLNCWKACNLSMNSLPQIYGCLTPDSGADLPTNLISSTCRAMATVIGGVDAIYFDLISDVSYLNEFRRLTRNIHYILRYESNLNHRIDPVCGSYNLEYMTEALAAKVWNKIGGMDPERAS